MNNHAGVGTPADQMGANMLQRYRAAAALEPGRLLAMMRHRTVQPHWTGDGDLFWYRRDRDGGGHEYVLVDPETFSRRPLFDHEVLAARLADLLGSQVDPRRLPIAAFRDDGGVQRIELTDGRCVVGHAGGPLEIDPGRGAVLPGPDGKNELFLRDHDVWIRDCATDEERALTTGGEPFHAWGALPDYTCVHIPLKRSGRTLPPAFTAFSPSGHMVVTVRLDEREVQPYPFVEHLPAGGGRPVLHPIRCTLDGERAEGSAQLAFIDLTTATTTVVDVETELLSSLLSTGIEALTWDEESHCVYLLAHATGRRTATLQRIDVRTGERRAVVTETADPLYEPNTYLYSLPLVRVLPRSRTVVWFSQRDGWGQLHRYDLDSGAYLGAITRGNIVVRDILHIDEEHGYLLFLAGCGDDGHNPYWRKLFRSSIDGSNQTLLTPEPVDHEIPAPAPQFFELVFGVRRQQPISPSGRLFVDQMSTVSQPPEIVLRNTDSGGIIGTLERTDVGELVAAGYRAPEQFRVAADDGGPDIWGVLTVPADVPEGTSVPVIDLMYAGFQVASQPTCFLGPDPNQKQVLAAASYAALGFATVVLDGRGTSGRDKQFRQWTRGNLDPARGLQDHVTAIRALAQRHPVLDAGRVGVTGHSYGGYNSVRSMLLFPDFFKVGVSSAGVHVPEKMPKGSWDWHVGPDAPHDRDTYRTLGNLHLVDQLRGRLLLLFGDLDENATPDHTLALVDALMRAGKRFDMKLLPGVDHYGAGTAYVRMVTWDYFVQHLLGRQPPSEFAPATDA